MARGCYVNDLVLLLYPGPRLVTHVSPSPLSLLRPCAQLENQVGFAQKEGSPIIHARVSGNFAMVECRSIEETSALLNLNNIPFLGQVRARCGLTCLCR